MSEFYKRIGNYVLVTDGAHFGITDNSGETLLPCEYDSIFYECGGFVITKNSKSGYVKFYEKASPHDECESIPGAPERRAEHYLACVYDRIEPTRNGLVLCSMTSDPYSSEKRSWFDVGCGKLYESLCYLRNHREFDEFLDMDDGTQMPLLKRRGEDLYVRVPFDLTVHVLYEIPIYSDNASYFVCCEELTESEARQKGYGYEYFFMIILPDSYIFTEPEKNIKDIFKGFPEVIEKWERGGRVSESGKNGNPRQKSPIDNGAATGVI